MGAERTYRLSKANAIVQKKGEVSLQKLQSRVASRKDEGRK